MGLVSGLARSAGRLAIAAASLRPVRGAARLLFKLLTPAEDFRVAWRGRTLYASTPDRLAALLIWKYSEPSSLEAGVYRSCIKPGMTVLDIGANIGFFTALFSDLAGAGGKVIAFEPDPENFRLLLKNSGTAGNVKCEPKAVDAAPGIVKLFVSEEHRGDHRIFDSGDGRASVEVEAVSVDALLGPGGRADFVKIDVQGAEYGALLGMETTLRNSPGAKVFCEFSPALLRKAGSDPRRLLDLMLGRGFTMKYLDESSKSLAEIGPEAALALCPGEKYLNLLFEKLPKSG
jgi:FkbM family methyltransferase